MGEDMDVGALNNDEDLWFTKGEYTIHMSRKVMRRQEGPIV